MCCQFLRTGVLCRCSCAVVVVMGTVLCNSCAIPIQYSIYAIRLHRICYTYYNKSYYIYWTKDSTDNSMSDQFCSQCRTIRDWQPLIAKTVLSELLTEITSLVKRITFDWQNIFNEKTEWHLNWKFSLHFLCDSYLRGQSVYDFSKVVVILNHFQSFLGIKTKTKICLYSRKSRKLKNQIISRFLI